MATITGLTADRMQQIIDKTIVSASIVGGHLILTLSDGSTIDAGNAMGPQGAPGIAKVTAFPPAPADGDIVIRTDQAGDPVYKYTTAGGWGLLGGGLAKVTAFPAAPLDGDAVIRTDLNGSPIFTYSPENGWEQMPRMGAQTVPAVKAKLSADQSIPTGVDTRLTWAAEEYDTNNMHDLVTNNGRLTCVTPGVYMFRCGIAFAAGSAGTTRRLVIAKNGWGSVADQIAYEVAPATSTRLEAVATMKMAAGDYVEAFCFQDTGGALSVLSGNGETAFSAVWLGGPGQTVDERGVPAVRVTNSTAPSIPNNVGTAVLFDTEIYDTDDSHSLTANTTRLTAKTPGIYRLFAAFWWADVPAAARQAWFRINGAGQHASIQNVNRAQTLSTEVQLAAGDYVEFVVFQNSGAAVNILQEASDSPIFGMSMVGTSKTVTPFAWAYASTGIAGGFPTGAYTAVPLNSENADNDGIHDLVTNTSRLTCRTAGVYMVQGRVVFSVSGAGTRAAVIGKNGVNTVAIDYGNPASNNYIEVAGLVELAVGDYLELKGYQDSGSALNVVGDTAGESCALKMIKVGAPNARPANVPSSQADVFTVATLPAANTVPAGRMVFVSDGAAGQQARMSTGSAWINLG